MAGLSELEALELCRRSLAARSDLYRASLTVEYHEIKESTAWMRQAFSWTRAAAPLLLLVVSWGPVLLGRRRVVPRSTVGKLILGWRTARSLKSLWRGFSSNGSQA